MIQYVRSLIFFQLPRKLLALFAAVLVWVAIDQASQATKRFQDVRIQIINIPEDRAVEYILSAGTPTKTMAVSLHGKKSILDSITQDDIEVVIDAKDHTEDEWVATLNASDIVSLLPGISLHNSISTINHESIIVKYANVITEQVPVFITRPVGHSPKGYTFLDVWPYEIQATVTGIDKEITELKQKGLKLTYNLNEIKRSTLENSAPDQSESDNDIITFYPPKHWNEIHKNNKGIRSIQIGDDYLDSIRLEFIRSELVPFNGELQLASFLPTSSPLFEKFKEITFSGPSIKEKSKATFILSHPLFAKGVSRLFLETVKDMITIIAIPTHHSHTVETSIQFINPIQLENKYVSKILSSISDNEIKRLSPELRQIYLRNRFRSYMNKFRLVKDDNSPLTFTFDEEHSTIVVK